MKNMIYTIRQPLGHNPVSLEKAIDAAINAGAIVMDRNPGSVTLDFNGTEKQLRRATKAYGYISAEHTGSADQYEIGGSQ